MWNQTQYTFKQVDFQNLFEGGGCIKNKVVRYLFSSLEEKGE